MRWINVAGIVSPLVAVVGFVVLFSTPLSFLPLVPIGAAVVLAMINRHHWATFAPESDTEVSGAMLGKWGLILGLIGCGSFIVYVVTLCNRVL